MSEATKEPYRLERKWSNGCEVCPQVWRGNDWVCDVIGAPYLGFDSIAKGKELVRKLNAHDDLLAACEMQAAIEGVAHKNIDWDSHIELLSRHGWDGNSSRALFVRRFRDAAIKKARSQ